MSKITKRETVPLDDRSLDDRLARVLDSPLLARVVPLLPPEALHNLIRLRGLDACTELVTLATPAQLTSVLDLDLWRHPRPGVDQQFDVARFGEWIETLVDAGDTTAARTVAGIGRDLVIAGLARYVRVFDPGIFEPTAQSDDETIDRPDAMREGDTIYGGRTTEAEWLECEVAGYLVRARRADAWDAIVTLLIALDAAHNDFFHAVMAGVRRLSNSRPEIDGLDDLLLAPEQHLHELAIGRERRQSQQGYASPADARAFFEMARRPKDRQSAPFGGSQQVNPIVAAYFREVDEAGESSIETPAAMERRLQSPASSTPSDNFESVDAFVDVLIEASMRSGRPRALLGASSQDEATATLTHLRRLMAHAVESDGALYLTVGRQLAFLSNTLLAGCSIHSRAFTRREASDAAAAICNLGLEYESGRSSLAIDLVSAFEVGWSILHRDVSLFAADQLIATLTDFTSVDHDMTRGLRELRRMLVKHRDAGTPWRAREAAEILAMIDTTAWVSIIGLLDECPILPAALTAIVEGRTTTIDPAAFDFISTSAQISDVRAFLRKLPELLSR